MPRVSGDDGMGKINDMHIAIIGTGNVGVPLGRRLSALGYQVAFGARDVAAAREKLQGIAADVASPRDAAARAQVVLQPARAVAGAARHRG